MNPRFSFLLIVFFCLSIVATAQQAVLFKKEASAAFVQATDLKTIRQRFPLTLPATDSILWYGSLPIPLFCNGASGRFELPPSSHVQDSCFLSFAERYPCTKALSMPNAVLAHVNRDPLKWSPAPVYAHYLFDARPATDPRFSVSLSRTKASPFMADPFVVLSESGAMSVLVFTIDSMYAFQPESGKSFRVPMPDLRQKQASGLLYPATGHQDVFQITAAALGANTNRSLFLDQGDEIRMLVFQSLSQGWGAVQGQEKKRGLVLSILQDYQVAAFDDPNVNEMFYSGVITLMDDKELPEPEKKERFWKLTSEAGKAGFKSLIQNPVLVSGLMWTRLGSSKTESLLISCFMPQSGQIQTWRLDPFSQKPEWEQMKDKENQELWKRAGQARNLNERWKTFFIGKDPATAFQELFPDLLDR
jgi:hypothetical protein